MKQTPYEITYRKTYDAAIKHYTRLARLGGLLSLQDERRRIMKEEQSRGITTDRARELGTELSAVLELISRYQSGSECGSSSKAGHKAGKTMSEHLHIKESELNFDAEWSDTLADFAQKAAKAKTFSFERSVDAKTARKWGKHLGRMAQMKSIAMSLRGEGKIRAASHLEDKVEILYRQLPSWLKW